MKKPRKPHSNHERWMVSYADFMTLLFAFFVVLYSSAEVDKAKMANLSNAITAGFSSLGVGAGGGGAPIIVPGTIPAPYTHPSPLTESAEEIRNKLEIDLAAELKGHIVSLRPASEGLVLSLHDVGFFDSGAANLRANSMGAFDRIGAALATIHSNLRIEGHTDNVPIHTPQFQSNWELSTARATEIIRLLLEREGIAPERLSAAGYAEFHPIADNATEDGRRLNRRVDIVIVAPHLAAPSPQPPTAAQASAIAGQASATAGPVPKSHPPQ